MSRYFVRQLVQPGTASLQLDARAADFLANVLRLQKGDFLTVCDGAGMDLYCQISQINHKTVVLQVLSQAKNNTEPYYEVQLYQGVLKGEKMTDVIQRSVELGVSRIIPVSSQHSIVHVKEKNQEKKMGRWTRVATAAASQARRGLLPEVASAQPFQACLLQAAAADLALLVTDEPKAESIRSCLAGFAANNSNWQKPVISLLTGPEGGWSGPELEAARSAGCRLVSLGRRSLQAQSAGPVALAMLLYQFDQF